MDRIGRFRGRPTHRGSRGGASGGARRVAPSREAIPPQPHEPAPLPPHSQDTREVACEARLPFGGRVPVTIDAGTQATPPDDGGVGPEPQPVAIPCGSFQSREEAASELAAYLSRLVYARARTTGTAAGLQHKGTAWCKDHGIHQDSIALSLCSEAIPRVLSITPAEKTYEHSLNSWCWWRRVDRAQAVAAGRSSDRGWWQLGARISGAVWLTSAATSVVGGHLGCGRAVVAGGLVNLLATPPFFICAYETWRRWGVTERALPSGN